MLFLKFGSFTSSPWRITNGYFGSGESFLWKLRYNRNKTPCHSLFEQAHLESEIDVFPFSRLNSCVQLCTGDTLAVGCGGISKDCQTKHEGLIPDSSNNTNEFKQIGHGFGFALQSNLQYGTTSPCTTFCSPSLTSSGDVFEVSNLEVWTFTPFFTVVEAERLEMKKFFLEGTFSSSTSSYHQTLQRRPPTTRQKSAPQGFFSQENQDDFYRRVGQEERDDYQRNLTF